MNTSRFGIVVIAAVLTWGERTQTQTSTQTTSGTYPLNSNSNWGPATVPNAANASATFSSFTGSTGFSVNLGQNNTVGSLSITNSKTSNQTFQINSGNTLTFSQTGAGMLTLNESVSEPTSINDGSLRLGASGRLASGRTLPVSDSGTVDLQRFNHTVSNRIITGNGSIVGTGTITNSSAYSFTDAGRISTSLAGTGGLTKAAQISCSIFQTVLGERHLQLLRRWLGANAGSKLIGSTDDL